MEVLESVRKWCLAACLLLPAALYTRKCMKVCESV